MRTGRLVVKDRILAVHEVGILWFLEPSLPQGSYEPYYDGRATIAQALFNVSNKKARIHTPQNVKYITLGLR